MRKPLIAILKLSLGTLMLSTLLTLIGCKPSAKNLTPQGHNLMKEYRWSITESAPTEYPIFITDGYMKTADGYKKGLPTGVIVDTGWFSGRSFIAAGREVMTVPTEISLTWFSYREDTFYHGTFTLPHEEILGYMENNETFPYNNEHREGHMFTLGLAPKGYLVLWLSTTMSERVVFTGQAKPVNDVPWKYVSKSPDLDRAGHIKMVLDESLAKVADSPYLNTPDHWRELHEDLYTYDIVIESEYTPFSIEAFFRDHTMEQRRVDQQNWTEQPHGVLEGVGFDFLFPQHVPAQVVNDIDIEEFKSAMKILQAQNAGIPRVVFTVKGNLFDWKYNATVRIENDKQTIELHNYEARAVDNFSTWTNRIEPNLDYVKPFINYPNKPATP